MIYLYPGDDLAQGHVYRLDVMDWDHDGHEVHFVQACYVGDDPRSADSWVDVAGEDGERIPKIRAALADAERRLV